MNTRTLGVVDVDQDKLEELRQKMLRGERVPLIPIPPDEEERVKRMNRHQLRKWTKEQRQKWRRIGRAQQRRARRKARGG